MQRVSSVICGLAILLCGACAIRAAEPTATLVADQFDERVRPFLEQHCVSCHGGTKPESDLDLSQFTSLESVTQDHPRWLLVRDRLKAGNMPPEDAQSQPTAESRRDIVAWIENVRMLEACRTAGDPGVVLPRRLRNAEYDYTIRDLTGFDLRPRRSSPSTRRTKRAFDNCCLMYLSNMWSGSKHDSNGVTLLTVGGLGGTLQTGRVLNYMEAGDDNRKLCSLYLSLMDRMGVQLERFGDADTRLAGL